MPTVTPPEAPVLPPPTPASSTSAFYSLVSARSAAYSGKRFPSVRWARLKGEGAASARQCQRGRRRGAGALREDVLAVTTASPPTQGLPSVCLSRLGQIATFARLASRAGSAEFPLRKSVLFSAKGIVAKVLSWCKIIFLCI